ncbi:unnamed protein product [Caenorhabditis angaria]|uniref:Methylosome subunit pICln n=1 Tax=Caenorhabditis angaria TaxID=860376 RepID=A0A9P1N5C0_9PELO|nr:unnamed protein product [Caenorhabditis angaria]
MVILTDTSVPTDTIKLTQNSVQAYAGTQSLGNGKLYVSESTLAWIKDDNKDLTNFGQEHIYVLVDGNKTENRRRRRAPLLMTQNESAVLQDIQMANNELNGAGEEEEGEDDDSEAGKSIEFRFVPDNKDTLSEIYHEICVCQELNPEEDESFSEDDMDYEGDELNGGTGAGDFENGDGHQWITSDNIDSSDLQLSEEGMANLNRMLGRGNRGNNEENQDDEEMQQ